MLNKKGMTLIEVIVALAVFAILMVMTTGVFSTAINISTKSIEINDKSHNAQNNVNKNNGEVETTPGDVGFDFELDFNGKPVKGKVDKYHYASDDLELEFDSFKVK